MTGAAGACVTLCVSWDDADASPGDKSAATAVDPVNRMTAKGPTTLRTAKRLPPFYLADSSLAEMRPALDPAKLDLPNAICNAYLTWFPHHSLAERPPKVETDPTD
jgi:hypothetical protein